VHKPRPEADGRELSGAELAELLTAASVLIDRNGTGWVYSASERNEDSGNRAILIVTNHHVVARDDQPVPLQRVSIEFPLVDSNGDFVAERTEYSDANKYTGWVLKSWPDKDLAFIRVDAPVDVSALALAREGARPGDVVHSVGNPGASEAYWVYHRGIVRQRVRTTYELSSYGTVDARILETDQPMNGGDSGGVVVNNKGRVVGVNSSIVIGYNNISQCIDRDEIADAASEMWSMLRDPDGRFYSRLGRWHYENGDAEGLSAAYELAKQNYTDGFDGLHTCILWELEDLLLHMAHAVAPWKDDDFRSNVLRSAREFSSPLAWEDRRERGPRRQVVSRRQVVQLMCQAIIMTADEQFDAASKSLCDARAIIEGPAGLIGIKRLEAGFFRPSYHPDLSESITNLQRRLSSQRVKAEGGPSGSDSTSTGAPIRPPVNLELRPYRFEKLELRPFVFDESM
jgi:hypothetical protein